MRIAVLLLLAGFVYGLWQLLKFDLLRLRHGAALAQATIVSYHNTRQNCFLRLYRFHDGEVPRFARIRASAGASRRQDGALVRVTYPKGHPRLAQQHKPVGRPLGYLILLTLAAISANLVLNGPG